jgi:cytochrome c554/c'-like protein
VAAIKGTERLPKFKIATYIALCVGVTITAIVASAQTKDWTEQAQLEFLKQHWQNPLSPQGKPPADWSPQESTLAPEACGSCHPAQFRDWQTTVHGRSVRPGLLGQTPTLLREEPKTAKVCYTCHAPLSEQQEVIWSGQRIRKNVHFDSNLQSKGLTCAACHVRNNQRYGPPRPDGSLESTKPTDQLSHGDATRTPAFERAEFCMGCHQFQPDGNALNGKLLENTYNEWKNGPYAAQGIQCQQCHMPDRRHLWRGIHDPEMVKEGVTIDLQLSQAAYRVGEKLEATLTLMNSGVGHYFPTYVTPKVVLRIQLLDPNGQVITESVKEEIVGRQVTLDLDREIADTRIPPKGMHVFRYAGIVNRAGLKLHAEVVVYPDEFYRQFYEAKLAGQLSKIERQRLGIALEDTRKSVYRLFEKDVSL